jgi:hypothetical protein
MGRAKMIYLLMTLLIEQEAQAKTFLVETKNETQDPGHGNSQTGIFRLFAPFFASFLKSSFSGKTFLGAFCH